MAETFDEIEFIITWDGAAEASLHLVVDNDDLVATDRDGVVGAGKVRHRYRTAPAVFHVIEWSLRFEGRTVRNLVATASINGDKPVTLDAVRDDRKHLWVSRGAAP